MSDTLQDIELSLLELENSDHELYDRIALTDLLIGECHLLLPHMLLIESAHCFEQKRVTVV